MGWKFLAASLLLFGQSPVLAQGATDCTKITDPKARLECFDNAAKSPKVPVAPPSQAKPAADPTIAAARAAVANVLKDPPSARFDGVVKKADAVCGYINAKNSYGGYAGRVRFVYILKTKEVFLEIPITSLSGSNLAEYEAADAALTRHCPGVKSPFLK